MLNVDIVSQFDPAVVQELATLVEDCEACTARMNQRMERARKCLEGDLAQEDPNKSMETEA